MTNGHPGTGGVRSQKTFSHCANDTSLRMGRTIFPLTFSFLKVLGVSTKAARGSLWMLQMSRTLVVLKMVIFRCPEGIVGHMRDRLPVFAGQVIHPKWKS